jgi:hypothetical protein
VDASRFLAQWDRQIADWCVDDLMRDGTEAVLLQPLARWKWAAVQLVEHASASADYRQRKAAAILAGFVDDPPTSLLDDLFERESERNALAEPETTEPLCCQSVVEDAVLAAARWCRKDTSRPAGLALLRKVVERTLVGEYWSAATYAMATLCRHRAADVDALLQSFLTFAQGSPPSHPTSPTLATERGFARRLMAGQSEALEAVEAVLDRQEEASRDVHLDPEAQAMVDEWFGLAARIG